MNGRSSQRMGSGGDEIPRTAILPANWGRALRAIRSLTKIAARTTAAGSPPTTPAASPRPKALTAARATLINVGSRKAEATQAASPVANRTSPWPSGGHAILDQGIRRALRGRSDGDSARGCDEFGDLVEGGDGEPGDQSGSGGDNYRR